MKSRAYSLRGALSYKNKDVVYAFTEKYAVSFREAEEIFVELQKFLWLIAEAKRRAKKPPFITPHTTVIDEMWHNFVLFTSEYRKYCDTRYGFYIDHSPTTKAERDLVLREARVNPAAAKQRWDAEFREQLSLIYDELGRRTVLKWYQQYPVKYSAEKLENLRRKRFANRPVRRNRNARH